MKKVLLFAAAAMAISTSFAQVSRITSAPSSIANELKTSSSSDEFGHFGSSAQKTTVLGDTFYTIANANRIYNGPSSNVNLEFVAPLDSGSYYGPNAFGSKGFARAISTNLDKSAPIDSTVQFLGWFTRWGGRIQANSTKQITFNLWDRGTTKTPLPIFNNKVFAYGKPNVVKASKTVAASSIMTNASRTFTYVTTPISKINYASYIGVTFSNSFSATDVDTFGVRSSDSVNVENISETVVENSTKDTLVTIPMYLLINGSWVSPRYDLRLPEPAPIIAAIVRFDRPASVKGFETNELTVFGAYPNPSATITKFKFALKSATGVKTEFYDYSGRLIASHDLGQRPAGEQTTDQDVANLPNGMYIFVVSTSKGDVIATAVDVKH